MQRSAERAARRSIGGVFVLVGLGSCGGVGCGSSDDSGGGGGAGARAGAGTHAGDGGSDQTSAGTGGTAGGAGAVNAAGRGGAGGGGAGGAAGTSGGCAACGETQYCIYPCCGGIPQCLPAPESGACPPGSSPGCIGACSYPSGCCQQPCMPGPPYCADRLPIGCLQAGDGARTCQLTCG